MRTRGLDVRILVVSHETSRTGAPRIGVLVTRTLVGLGHHVRVVARARGPLLQEFAAETTTFVEPFDRVRRRLWATPGLSLLALVVDTALAAITIVRRRPDLVYVNSTAAAVYLRPALWLRRRVLLHVHESKDLASVFFGRARCEEVLPRCILVACSPSVRIELAELAGVDTDEVILLPSVPDETEVRTRGSVPPDHGYVAEQLVVGCCGTVESRKGADLWLDAARLVLRAARGLPVRFVWVGEVAQPELIQEAPGEVEFLGPSRNPYPHLRRFDVATLPSRDDPFPLVVLEAMALGTPVVAFSVGGVAEQIGDAGLLVPPQDVEKFAAAVVSLLESAAERRRLGAEAARRVESRFSTSAFRSRLEGIVEAL
jgi:glycosyltransferase involved in cell wall biosynthesis